MGPMEYISLALPAAVSIMLVAFVWRVRQARKMNFDLITAKYIRVGDPREEAVKDVPKPIRDVLVRKDVTLRLLEEIHRLNEASYYYRRMPGTRDSLRLHLLDDIESELQSYLRESVKAEDFPEISQRVLTLLDEVRREKSGLVQREPFNDIQDPEKSLLIDIFNELPANSSLVRQKAVQLSNIIKLKHQDVSKLQADNVRAGLWTKWGTAGTVFFGLLSLVLSLLPILSK